MKRSWDRERLLIHTHQASNESQDLQPDDQKTIYETRVKVNLQGEVEHQLYPQEPKRSRRSSS